MTSPKRFRSWACALNLGVFLVLGGLSMTGCDDEGPVLSLGPFYSQLDVESDQRLSGSWTDPDGDLTFTFQEDEGNEYRLMVTETQEGSKSSAEFEAHLLRLGPYWFLDFLPVISPQGNSFWQMHMFRAHSVAKIEVSQDTLQIAFFDGSWLRKQIDENNLDISYQWTDGALLLTATTEEVQRLVYLYATDDDAFPNALTLSRDEVER